MNVDIIIPIVAILTVFGVIGFTSIKLISFLRDWLVPKEPVGGDDRLIRRLDQYEQRQEQLVKRIQNLETMIVDMDSTTPKLSEAQMKTIQSKTASAEPVDRPLKNKLRS